MMHWAVPWICPTCCMEIKEGIIIVLHFSCLSAAAAYFQISCVGFVRHPHGTERKQRLHTHTFTQKNKKTIQTSSLIPFEIQHNIFFHAKHSTHTRTTLTKKNWKRTFFSFEHKKKVAGGLIRVPQRGAYVWWVRPLLCSLPQG